MTDLIGHSLGRYHILEQLGEGGMAIVYKARDTRLEVDVAVKVIRTENLTLGTMDRTLKRFEREAKSLARLTHPNIVKVTDYGEYENKPYLVMPYLSGGTLKSKLNGKPMPCQDAMQILIPIADALGYAHKHDIIHRDVKPANILITENGQPMLADFGVAKLLDVEETMELTGTGVGIGTPEYMAPEQVTNKLVDARADIYALGVVLFEMVTGRKPYVADTPMAVLFKHASEPLPRPRQFVPALPQAVENLIIKSLAKKPEDRYQNMTDFAKAMEQVAISYKKQADRTTQRKDRAKSRINPFKSFASSFAKKLAPIKSIRPSPRQTRFAGYLIFILLGIWGLTWITQQSYFPIPFINNLQIGLLSTSTHSPAFLPLLTLTPSAIPTRIATSTQVATNTPDPTIQMLTDALTHTRSSKPAYSFTFDQPSSWNFNLPENVKTSNGELVIIDGSRTEASTDHWNAASIRPFTSHAFAVSFDFRIEGDGGDFTHCGFEVVDFKSNGNIALRNMYLFIPKNVVHLEQTSDNRGFPTVAQGVSTNDFTQTTSATIILLDTNSAVFINDKLELIHKDKKDTVDFEEFSLSANGTSDGLTCYFDNFKVWDLGLFLESK